MQSGFTFAEAARRLPGYLTSIYLLKLPIASYRDVVGQEDRAVVFSPSTAKFCSLVHWTVVHLVPPQSTSPVTPQLADDMHSSTVSNTAQALPPGGVPDTRATDSRHVSHLLFDMLLKISATPVDDEWDFCRNQLVIRLLHIDNEDLVVETRGRT